MTWARKIGQLAAGDQDVAPEHGQEHRRREPARACGRGAARSSQRPAGEVDEHVLEAGLAEPDVGELAELGAGAVGRPGATIGGASPST